MALLDRCRHKRRRVTAKPSNDVTAADKPSNDVMAVDKQCALRRSSATSRITGKETWNVKSLLEDKENFTPFSAINANSFSLFPAVKEHSEFSTVRTGRNHAIEKIERSRLSKTYRMTSVARNGTNTHRNASLRQVDHTRSDIIAAGIHPIGDIGAKVGPCSYLPSHQAGSSSSVAPSAADSRLALLQLEAYRMQERYSNSNGEERCFNSRVEERHSNSKREERYTSSRVEVRYSNSETLYFAGSALLSQRSLRDVSNISETSSAASLPRAQISGLGVEGAFCSTFSYPLHSTLLDPGPSLSLVDLDTSASPSSHAPSSWLTNSVASSPLAPPAVPLAPPLVPSPRCESSPPDGRSWSSLYVNQSPEGSPLWSASEVAEGAKRVPRSGGDGAMDEGVERACYTRALCTERGLYPLFGNACFVAGSNLNNCGNNVSDFTNVSPLSEIVEETSAEADDVNVSAKQNIGVRGGVNKRLRSEAASERDVRRSHAAALHSHAGCISKSDSARFPERRLGTECYRQTEVAQRVRPDRDCRCQGAEIPCGMGTHKFEGRREGNLPFKGAPGLRRADAVTSLQPDTNSSDNRLTGERESIAEPTQNALSDREGAVHRILRRQMATSKLLRRVTLDPGAFEAFRDVFASTPRQSLSSGARPHPTGSNHESDSSCSCRCYDNGAIPRLVDIGCSTISIDVDVSGAALFPSVISQESIRLFSHGDVIPETAAPENSPASSRRSSRRREKPKPSTTHIPDPTDRVSEERQSVFGRAVGAFRGSVHPMGHRGDINLKRLDRAAEVSKGIHFDQIRPALVELRQVKFNRNDPHSANHQHPPHRCCQSDVLRKTEKRSHCSSEHVSKNFSAPVNNCDSPAKRGSGGSIADEGTRHPAGPAQRRKKNLVRNFREFRRAWLRGGGHGEGGVRLTTFGPL